MEQGNAPTGIRATNELNETIILNRATTTNKPYLKTGDRLKEHANFFRGKSNDFIRKKRAAYLHEEHNIDLEALGKLESAPTYPYHTAIYKSWLRNNAPFKSHGDSWLFIAVVAILMGIITFVIKHAVDGLYIFHFQIIKSCMAHGELIRLWFYYASFSVFFSCIASIITIYVCPSAAGSGMPELMAILNGVVIRKMLSVQVLFWKMLSSVLTILSTLPVGFEGPMIHIGSMVPTILTAPYKCCQSIGVPEDRYANDHVQGSRISRWWTRIWTRIRSDMCRLRDGHERQVLACIGAASGVAAALNAPITGLCFSMEEMSSSWSNTRTWQTLFSCVMACSVHVVLNAVLNNTKAENMASFDYSIRNTPIFDIKEKLLVGVRILLPAICIGVIGGLMSYVYVTLYLSLARLRARIFKGHQVQVVKALKIVDVFIVTVLFTSIVILTLPTYSCRPVRHQQKLEGPLDETILLLNYKCKEEIKENRNETGRPGDDTTLTLTGEYHEVATLFLNTWEQLIRNMYSRKTPEIFSISALSMILVVIFVFSSLAGSASLSGGLMIPQLAIGAVYGRILGQTFQSLYELIGGDQTPHDELDPGLYALLGSASFFTGTSRLPITSVIMMIEMTNDANYSFAIILSVLIAKKVGDLCGKSLYHTIMEEKHIPFLDSELRIHWDNKRINLEIFEAGDIMATPVRCVEMIESVRHLAEILTTTHHGAFPVVMGTDDSPRGLLGLISREEIVILLCNLDTEHVNLDLYDLTRMDIERLHKMYYEYSRDPKILKNVEALNKLMNVYLHDARYKDLYVDLIPYLDTSTVRISKTFSLERTFLLFREMGLRQMVVIDNANQVEGIITRKDLLEHVVEHKIHELIMESASSSYSELTEVVPVSDEMMGTLQIKGSPPTLNLDLQRNRKVTYDLNDEETKAVVAKRAGEQLPD